MELRKRSKMDTKIVVVVSLAAIMVGLIGGAPPAGAVTTAVKVVPTTQGATAGGPVTLNITVENVADLGANQATVHFDPLAMSVSQVTEGAFLKSAGTTLGAGMEIINNNEGYVTFFYALTSEGIGVDGSGTLATIHFDTSASSTGLFNMGLSDVLVATGTGDPIPVDVVNGSVNLVPFAVTLTSPESETFASTSINVNFALQPEWAVLDWAAYSLDGGSNVTIEGNTIINSLSLGEHYLVLYARDNDGNTAASNTVYFAIHPADITGDEQVNVFDLQQLAWAFNAQPASPNWNEAADLNCDDAINIFDLQILAWNFGNTYT
jgi:hypothetical protein